MRYFYTVNYADKSLMHVQ